MLHGRSSFSSHCSWVSCFPWLLAMVEMGAPPESTGWWPLCLAKLRMRESTNSFHRHRASRLQSISAMVIDSTMIYHDNLDAKPRNPCGAFSFMHCRCADSQVLRDLKNGSQLWMDIWLTSLTLCPLASCQETLCRNRNLVAANRTKRCS